MTDKVEEVIMKTYKHARSINMHTTLILDKTPTAVLMVKLVVNGGEVR